MSVEVKKGVGKTDAGATLQGKIGYWEARKHMLYYKALLQFGAVVGYDAKSVIDVGSASTDYINWMSWIPNRYVLDFRVPKRPEGCVAIETDFLKFESDELFDLAFCCQVLEHVPEPKPFCTKLKGICRNLIISVPYKWLGGAPGHIHDPVDEAKLEEWMGIIPNSSQVVYEPFREGRLIAYYDLVGGPKTRFDKEFIFRAIAERSRSEAL